MIDISKIRVVPDYPKKGVQFLDITTIMNDADFFQDVYQQVLDMAKAAQPDVILGLESRGFFFAPAIALALHLPFVPVRKAGKLPAATYQASYELEYGTAAIEIHQDAFKPHQRVLIFDDVLATGGTAAAAVKLAQNFQPTYIATHFLMEIKALHGREQIMADEIRTLHTIE